MSEAERVTRVHCGCVVCRALEHREPCASRLSRPARCRGLDLAFSGTRRVVVDVTRVVVPLLCLSTTSQCSQCGWDDLDRPASATVWTMSFCMRCTADVPRQQVTTVPN